MRGIFYKKVGLFFLLFLAPGFLSAQVVINEVQVLPAGEKFLELYNSGSSAINLTGWSIKRKTASGSESSLVVASRLENKSVPAGGYFLIANETTYAGGHALDASWPSSNTGVASNNTVVVYNADGAEVDKVGWGEASDCPSPCPSSPPSGQSIQRTSTGWAVANPTPRQANAQTDSGISNESDTSTTTSNSSNTSSTSSGSVSTHYSSTPLSSRALETSLKISAGRERLGSVGSPLEFKAEGVSGAARDVRWNFGDGSEGYGETVVHTYEFPGEYVVVVSTQNNNAQAISRVNVKIIEADLVITSADSAKISIKNNSKHEINMYGRALWSGERTFLFPQDTIIRAGQEISFSSRITGLYPQTINNTLILTVGDTENAKIGTKIEEEKLAKMAEIEREIASLSYSLSVAYAQQVPETAFVSSLDEGEVITEEPELLETAELESVSQTASVINASPGLVDNEEGKGLWSKIKRFFLRTK